MSISKLSANLVDVSEYFLFSSPTEPCGPDRLTNTFGPFCFELEAEEQVELFQLPAVNDSQAIHIEHSMDNSNEQNQPVLALVKKRSSFKVELILEEFSLGQLAQDRAEIEQPNSTESFIEELKQREMISVNLQRKRSPELKPVECCRSSSFSTACYSSYDCDVEKILSEEEKLRREQRRERVDRYLAKKMRRIWNRRISYDCRKRFADTRVRVHGRFIRKVEEEVRVGLPEGSRQCRNSLPTSRLFELEELLY